MIDDARVLVGHVKALYRYPVKSMRGEALQEADLWWHGFEGDRRYGFFKSNNHSGFPWVTGRELPGMVLYTPRYAEPTKPRESAVIVTLPDGREFPVESSELMEEITTLAKQAAHLMCLYRGCYDAMPISLISTASISALGEAAGRTLDHRRFRPNVLIELTDSTPFAEEQWIGGSLLLFGDRDDLPMLRIARQNARCAMTNIDPDTAERDPRVLKTIVQTREECMGVYGSVQGVGIIHVGDPIYRIAE